MSDERTVRELVAAHRERRGLNKTQMAKTVGMSLSWVREVESGRMTMTMDMAEVVIDKLGLSVDEAATLRDTLRWERTSNEGRTLIAKAKAGRRIVEREIPGGTMSVSVIPVIKADFEGDPREVLDMQGAVKKQWAEAFIDDYIPVPSEVLERFPAAFALKVTGDEMAPKYPHGAYVVASAALEADDNRPAIVRAGGVIQCRIIRKAGAKITLEPINRDYAPREYEAQDVNWAYRVIGSWAWE